MYLLNGKLPLIMNIKVLKFFWMDEKLVMLIFGIVMRRTFKERYQLFFNFENFTDVRQTRYESLNSPITNTPQFTEVWAPLDGFYMNGGIRIML